MLNKLNAVSCMAIMPGWTADAVLLKPLPASVQIGLHLVLTNEYPLGPMPILSAAGHLPTLRKLTAAANARHLPSTEIAAEIRRQFDAFVKVHHAPPDFVDGHQHVHLLPGIRDIVLGQTLKRAPRAWVRNCADLSLSIMSRPFRGKAFASSLQSTGLNHLASTWALTTNDSFAGHYDFAADYKTVFPRFLRRPAHCHLVMCHPGAGYATADTIASARIREAAALRHMCVSTISADAGLGFP